MKVAYVMSRFPRLSETFVLGEMLAVEEQGLEVDLFPLLREREDIVLPLAGDPPQPTPLPAAKSRRLPGRAGRPPPRDVG